MELGRVYYVRDGFHAEGTEERTMQVVGRLESLHARATDPDKVAELRREVDEFRRQFPNPNGLDRLCNSSKYDRGCLQ